MSHPVSRPEHPDHDEPWAMQLVIHRNKQDPANHLDVLEAAGTAVVQLLDDPRTMEPDGTWADAVAHWRAGWIRKVARRAENKRWDDVHLLDGVTAASGSAQVRAFVPGPVAPLPDALRKLQVGGTELPRLRESSQVDTVVTVEVTPHVDLTTGKAAAQVGHAAQLAYERLVADATAGDQQAQRVLTHWREDAFRLRVQEPSIEQWQHADRPVRVVDAGLTEISEATETARALW
ncbi:MAG TPA: peptidyl-tRNA hydrolase [Enteractinococcus sp.]